MFTSISKFVTIAIEVIANQMHSSHPEINDYHLKTGLRTVSSLLSVNSLRTKTPHLQRQQNFHTLRRLPYVLFYMFLYPSCSSRHSPSALSGVPPSLYLPSILINLLQYRVKYQIYHSLQISRQLVDGQLTVSFISVLMTPLI